MTVVSLSPPGAACSRHPWHCPVPGRQGAPGLPHEPEWEAGVSAETEHAWGPARACWCEQPGGEIQDEKREWHFNPYPREQQLHYCEGKMQVHGDVTWSDRLLRHGLNRFSHNFSPFVLQSVWVLTNAGHDSYIILSWLFPRRWPDEQGLNGLVSKHFFLSWFRGHS